MKYGRLCRQIAWNILKDHQDAEECENDTYLRVWNSIPPKQPKALMAYVSRISRNLALNRLKYYGRKKRNREMDLVLSELSECIPAGTNVEASADDTVVQVLNAFLEELEEETRRMFVQRYFYMESPQVLGDRFHMSASNVSTKLNRTRQKLRKRLEQEGIFL